jgi:hypothetical protein
MKIYFIISILEWVVIFLNVVDQCQGHAVQSYVKKSAAATLSTTDANVVLCDTATAGATITMTLPDVSTLSENSNTEMRWRFIISDLLYFHAPHPTLQNSMEEGNIKHVTTKLENQ